MTTKTEKFTIGDDSQPWVVLKFGGTSVSSLACWKTIAEVVAERIDEGLKPIVVCSALSGISNDIHLLLDESLQNRHEPIFQDIVEKHGKLASELGVEHDLISCELDELSRIVGGAALMGEMSPRVRARAFAFGELMSTRLGNAYLKKIGLNASWCDARECLSARKSTGTNEYRRYLSAECDHDGDLALTQRFVEMDAGVIVTQGFIAGDSAGDTVLLGRGGSDISAAYFTAKLNACRCEIWTDVPGMYTANPRHISSARLLKRLDYEESQELSSSGAKVLHPRCIKPLRVSGIPLHIRCLEHPHAENTVIAADAQRTDAHVKAISSKKGVTLISMDSVDMWHEVGFLADLFETFKKHGLSVDLVSTSETNVTVTLDGLRHEFHESTIKSLVEDLEQFCQVRVVESCAQVTLVGRNIRAIMHKLGPALEVFEEQRVYLVSQAANDLNISFVVDEDQSDRLVADLHKQLFGKDSGHAELGPRWSELFEKSTGSEIMLPNTWWRERRDELLKLASEEKPLYVYDMATIDAQLAKLSSLTNADRIFYSLKANPHPQIMSSVYDAGFGFECVSANEVRHALELYPDIDPKRILFTPNFVARSEYEFALENGVIVTLDNLFPMENWPELFRGRDICVRMDPGKGRGHHKYVQTAGTKTKFGIPFFQIDDLERLAKNCGTRIVGLHAHVGSNIFHTDTWSETALFLANAAERFPDVVSLDLGGGLGIVEKAGGRELDMDGINAKLGSVKEAYPDYELWIEPGRFVVAEAGVLLTHVTQTKNKGDYNYVGVNAGMNALIRPALYGSHHEIVNLTKIDCGTDAVADIVGPICETGDILGYARRIAWPDEGDVILVATAGAYGRVMSSSYNLREPASELFLKS
jgi:bifunctional diaminopimelate decarboxylase / aspartate kinase